MVVQTAKVVKAYIPPASIVGIVPAEEVEQRAGGHGQNIAGAVGK